MKSRVQGLWGLGFRVSGLGVLGLRDFKVLPIVSLVVPFFG